MLLFCFGILTLLEICTRRILQGNFVKNLSFQWNKLQKLGDALRETEDTEDTGDTGDTGDAGLTGSTVFRHDLTEIKPKIGVISKQ